MHNKDPSRCATKTQQRIGGAGKRDWVGRVGVGGEMGYASEPVASLGNVFGSSRGGGLAEGAKEAGDFREGGPRFLRTGPGSGKFTRGSKTGGT